MRAMILLLPVMWLASCGGDDCTCDACETAIDLCDGDATCESDAVALCDDSGDTAR